MGSTEKADMLIADYERLTRETDRFRPEEVNPILLGLFGEVGGVMAAAGARCTAAGTSAASTTPPGPVPCRVARSTPRSAAMRRALGEARRRTLAPWGWDGTGRSRLVASGRGG